MPLFIAGFLETLLVDLKRRGRTRVTDKIRHLKSLMYNATQLDWDTILDMHAAVVIEIERGNREWGDSFWDIESRVYHTKQVKGINSTVKQPGGGVKGNNPGTGKPGSVMFCKAYQAGKCSKQSPHTAVFSGKTHTVSHICATCWLVTREKKMHPESSNECKYVGKSLQEAKAQQIGK